MESHTAGTSCSAHLTAEEFKALPLSFFAEGLRKMLLKNMMQIEDVDTLLAALHLRFKEEVWKVIQTTYNKHPYQQYEKEIQAEADIHAEGQHTLKVLDYELTWGWFTPTSSSEGKTSFSLPTTTVGIIDMLAWQCCVEYLNDLNYEVMQTTFLQALERARTSEGLYADEQSNLKAYSVIFHMVYSYKINKYHPISYPLCDCGRGVDFNPNTASSCFLRNKLPQYHTKTLLTRWNKPSPYVVLDQIWEQMLMEQGIVLSQQQGSHVDVVSKRVTNPVLFTQIPKYIPRRNNFSSSSSGSLDLEFQLNYLKVCTYFNYGRFLASKAHYITHLAADPTILIAQLSSLDYNVCFLQILEKYTLSALKLRFNCRNSGSKSNSSSNSSNGSHPRSAVRKLEDVVYFISDEWLSATKTLSPPLSTSYQNSAHTGGYNISHLEGLSVRPLDSDLVIWKIFSGVTNIQHIPDQANGINSTIFHTRQYSKLVLKGLQNCYGSDVFPYDLPKPSILFTSCNPKGRSNIMNPMERSMSGSYTIPLDFSKIPFQLQLPSHSLEDLGTFEKQAVTEELEKITMNAIHDTKPQVKGNLGNLAFKHRNLTTWPLYHGGIFLIAPIVHTHSSYFFKFLGTPAQQTNILNNDKLFKSVLFGSLRSIMGEPSNKVIYATVPNRFNIRHHPDLLQSKLESIQKTLYKWWESQLHHTWKWLHSMCHTSHWNCFKPLAKMLNFITTSDYIPCDQTRPIFNALGGSFGRPVSQWCLATLSTNKTLIFGTMDLHAGDAIVDPVNLATRLTSSEEHSWVGMWLARYENGDIFPSTRIFLLKSVPSAEMSRNFTDSLNYFARCSTTTDYDLIQSVCHQNTFHQYIATFDGMIYQPGQIFIHSLFFHIPDVQYRHHHQLPKNNAIHVAIDSLYNLNQIMHDYDCNNVVRNKNLQNLFPKTVLDFDTIQLCENLRHISQESTYNCVSTHHTNLSIFLQSYHEHNFGIKPSVIPEDFLNAATTSSPCRIDDKEIKEEFTQTYNDLRAQYRGHIPLTLLESNYKPSVDPAVVLLPMSLDNLLCICNIKHLSSLSSCRLVGTMGLKNMFSEVSFKQQEEGNISLDGEDEDMTTFKNEWRNYIFKKNQSKLKDYTLVYTMTTNSTPESATTFKTIPEDVLQGFSPITCSCEICTRFLTVLLKTFNYWWCYHDNKTQATFMSHIYGSLKSRRDEIEYKYRQEEVRPVFMKESHRTQEPEHMTFENEMDMLYGSAHEEANMLCPSELETNTCKLFETFVNEYYLPTSGLVRGFRTLKDVYTFSQEILTLATKKGVVTTTLLEILSNLNHLNTMSHMLTTLEFIIQLMIHSQFADPSEPLVPLSLITRSSTEDISSKDVDTLIKDGQGVFVRYRKRVTIIWNHCIANSVSRLDNFSRSSSSVSSVSEGYEDVDISIKFDKSDSSDSSDSSEYHPKKKKSRLTDSLPFMQNHSNTATTTTTTTTTIKTTTEYGYIESIEYFYIPLLHCHDKMNSSLPVTQLSNLRDLFMKSMIGKTFGFLSSQPPDSEVDRLPTYSELCAHFSLQSEGLSRSELLDGWIIDIMVRLSELGSNTISQSGGGTLSKVFQNILLICYKEGQGMGQLKEHPCYTFVVKLMYWCSQHNILELSSACPNHPTVLVVPHGEFVVLQEEELKRSDSYTTTTLPHKVLSDLSESLNLAGKCKISPNRYPKVLSFGALVIRAYFFLRSELQAIEGETQCYSGDNDKRVLGRLEFLSKILLLLIPNNSTENPHPQSSSRVNKKCESCYENNHTNNGGEECTNWSINEEFYAGKLSGKHSIYTHNISCVRGSHQEQQIASLYELWKLSLLVNNSDSAQPFASPKSESTIATKKRKRVTGANLPEKSLNQQLLGEMDSDTIVFHLYFHMMSEMRDNCFHHKANDAAGSPHKQSTLLERGTNIYYTDYNNLKLPGPMIYNKAATNGSDNQDVLQSFNSLCHPFLY